MTLYSVDIQKKLGAEYWTNRYIVEASDLAAASAIGEDIVDAERSVHSELVNFDKLRTSTVTKNDNNYIIVPLTGVGVLGETNAPIPLFNAARVDFGTNQGRPSRKYLRPGVSATYVQGTNWNTALYNALVSYGQAIVSLVGLRDVDGQEFLNSTAFRAIAMRQLRRGTKRKTQPVIS